MQRNNKLSATGTFTAETMAKLGQDFMEVNNNTTQMLTLPKLLQLKADGPRRYSLLSRLVLHAILIVFVDIQFADHPTIELDELFKHITNDRLRYLFRGRSKAEGGAGGTLTENILFGGREFGKSIVRGIGVAKPRDDVIKAKELPSPVTSPGNKSVAMSQE